MQIFTPNNLQSNTHWLSTIGALLLFSTFIAKDELRDYYKDALDEVIKADEGNLLSSNSVMLSDYTRLKRDNKWFTKSTNQALNGNTVFTVRPLVAEYRDFRDDLSNHAASAVKLLAVVEDLDKLPKAFDELPYEATEATLNEIPDYTDEQKDRTLTSTEKDKISKAQTAFSEYASKVIALESDVSNKTSVRQDARRARVKVFTILSYVLYPLGWTLAFVGKALEPRNQSTNDGDE